MARSFARVTADIRAFQPSAGDWQALDGLLSELWTVCEPTQVITELLAILERFPEDDGAGVLWSVVHGLESLPGYERELIRSVQRQPSVLGVTMIGRLLNGGTEQVGDVSLVDILQSIALSPSTPESVRAAIREWVGWAA